MKKIALGISSSISIYKSCEIIRGFQKKDIEVQVLMTKNATKLISPLLFSALTGKEVIIDPLSERSGTTIAHVSLAKAISLFLVAPATANIIGKFASGVADDFLSTFFLTVKCPVLVAPAMNEAMYFNKQTQANIQSLKARGVKFVEPEQGYLACQEEGWGRLAEPEDIIKQGLRVIKKGKSLKGKIFLITAGSTQEYLDPVRFLTNRSSGKMGYELAEEALSRGAKVILVSGPTHVFPPVEAEVREVRSAAEMEKEVLANFDRTDIVVMAAAVSDFKFARQSSNKIKKQELTKKVELVPTSDILKKLGQKKGEKILIGFAAETEKIQNNALEKLKRKNLDLIVANNVAEKGIGFESDYNQVFILEEKGEVIQTEKMSKREISGVILDKLEEIIGKRRRKTSK